MPRLIKTLRSKSRGLRSGIMIYLQSKPDAFLRGRVSRACLFPGACLFDPKSKGGWMRQHPNANLTSPRLCLFTCAHWRTLAFYPACHAFFNIMYFIFPTLSNKKMSISIWDAFPFTSSHVCVWGSACPAALCYVLFCNSCATWCLSCLAQGYLMFMCVLLCRHSMLSFGKVRRRSGKMNRHTHYMSLRW